MQGGGQVKTEQRRLVNAGTLRKQAPSSLVATMASPDHHSLAKTRGQDHTGSRKSWERGYTRVDTCTQDSRAFLPAHPRAQAMPAPHLPSRRWWASSAATPTG